MSRVPVLALGVALFLLAACGGERSTPEGTVRVFLDALQQKDTAAFRASFTDSTRALIGDLETLTAQAEAASGQPAITLDDWCTAFCGGSVEGSTLEGDSARVDVRVGEDVNQIPVVRVDREWRIDLSERLAPAVQMLRMTARPGAAAPGVAPDTIH